MYVVNTSTDEVRLIDDGTLPYWRNLGYEPLNDASALEDNPRAALGEPGAEPRYRAPAGEEMPGAGAAYLQVVQAGANAATERPEGAVAVYWLCDDGVDPVNKLPGDIVFNAEGSDGGWGTVQTAQDGDYHIAWVEGPEMTQPAGFDHPMPNGPYVDLGNGIEWSWGWWQVPFTPMDGGAFGASATEQQVRAILVADNYATGSATDIDPALGITAAKALYPTPDLVPTEA